MHKEADNLKLSIIIPSLNEAEHITQTLLKLQELRNQGHEVILCDGGSRDKTLQLAKNLVDHILSTQAGRAKQMNAGSKLATGDILCFLHADTLIPADFANLITGTLSDSDRIWGRFDIRLSNTSLTYKVIAWFINKRSCISGVATGDQGIFIISNKFLKLNGYADIPIMEDIELSKRLLKISRPICITKSFLITSSRRWEKNGIIKTVLLMWRLRLGYFLGASPTKLAKAYKNNA